MALAPIAPWIVPPDYVGAMSRGAQLGLSASEQGLQRQSAADRLSLAYKQLASEEQRASEATQARQEQAQAALALRAQQTTLMSQLREDNMNRQQEQAQAALDERREQARATEQFRQKNMERLQSATEATQKQQAAAFALKSEQDQKNLDLNVKKAQETADYHAGLLKKNADKPAASGSVSVQLPDYYNPGKTLRRTMSGAQYDATHPPPTDMGVGVGFGPPNPNLGGPDVPTPGVPMPAAAALQPKPDAPGLPTAPATKPIKIRRKSDGKTFIYKGDAADVSTDEYDLL